MSWTQKEKDLYEQSRALKMQAREMRKKRLEQEAIAEEARQLKIRNEREARRVERDQKIRAALRGMETAFRTHGVAFHVEGMHGDKSHAFDLNVEGYSFTVPVRFVAGTGFEWD